MSSLDTCSPYVCIVHVCRVHFRMRACHEADVQRSVNIGMDSSMSQNHEAIVFHSSKYQNTLGKIKINISVIHTRRTLFLQMTGYWVIMPRHQKGGGVLCYTLWNFECPSVRPSVRPSVSVPHHFSARNSSYSFRPILFKLYRRFKDGLRICILFFSESWNYF